MQHQSELWAYAGHPPPGHAGRYAAGGIRLCTLPTLVLVECFGCTIHGVDGTNYNGISACSVSQGGMAG